MCERVQRGVTRGCRLAVSDTESACQGTGSPGTCILFLFCCDPNLLLEGPGCKESPRVGAAGGPEGRRAAGQDRAQHTELVLCAETAGDGAARGPRLTAQTEVFALFP